MPEHVRSDMPRSSSLSQSGLRNSVPTLFFQPKLTVNTPGDTYEQEADRVADQVMRMKEGDAPIIRGSASPAVQRSLHSPWSVFEGDVEETSEGLVQTQRNNNSGDWADRDVAAQVNPAVQRAGASLPADTRRQMERNMGYDFTRVQIHTDASAAEAANAVQARAFTKGRHIVFDRGQYAPDTREGKRLLAHELTHVVQQGQASPQPHGATSPSVPAIQRVGTLPDVQRIQWNTARKTGRISYPWGKNAGYVGNVYHVETDAGTTIQAWKPHDGSTYWCHGFTFGGSKAPNGPFSIWGSEVTTVLNDEGWRQGRSCLARPGSDILVFWDAQQQLAHTGIVNSVSAPNAIIDENSSTLDSKWGYRPRNQNSWLSNANAYGRYRVFSKNPVAGPCVGLGPNEQ